jgi:hypothetical protein
MMTILYRFKDHDEACKYGYRSNEWRVLYDPSWKKLADFQAALRHFTKDYPHCDFMLVDRDAEAASLMLLNG